MCVLMCISVYGDRRGQDSCSDSSHHSHAHTLTIHLHNTLSYFKTMYISTGLTAYWIPPPSPPLPHISFTPLFPSSSFTFHFRPVCLPWYSYDLKFLLTPSLALYVLSFYKLMSPSSLVSPRFPFLGVSNCIFLPTPPSLTLFTPCNNANARVLDVILLLALNVLQWVMKTIWYLLVGTAQADGLMNFPCLGWFGCVDAHLLAHTVWPLESC